MTWPLCTDSLCTFCLAREAERESRQSIDTFSDMDDTAQRVLVYILRHDVRLGDNPVFHAASLASAVQNDSATKSTTDVDEQNLLPSFTHLLPVYVFPANQVEVSGFISDPNVKCPYPPAISQVAGLWRTGTHRLKFTAEGVWDVKEKLENLGSGSGLQIRVGKIGEVVEHILQWYAEEKDAGRSTTEVAGVCMTSEEGTEEKDDEADVRRAAKKRGVNFKLWTDEKYYVDELVPLHQAACLHYDHKLIL